MQPLGVIGALHLFRKSGEPHALAVAMTGVRLGDRLLQIGCADPSLVGAIGSKVGLSGRASIAVTDDTMASRARRGAEKAGVLIDIERLGQSSFDEPSFDLVVVDSTDGWLGSLDVLKRNAVLTEALRVLMPRGRIVVIEAGPREGLASLFRRAPVNVAYQTAGGSPAALTTAGFRAVRTLAERDGFVFVEGTK